MRLFFNGGLLCLPPRPPVARVGAWVWGELGRELGGRTRGWDFSKTWNKNTICKPSANHLQIFIFEEGKKGGRKGFLYLQPKLRPFPKPNSHLSFFFFKRDEKKELPTLTLPQPLFCALANPAGLGGVPQR
jgi:hypothetical protein